jgi:hypothetical protein
MDFITLLQRDVPFLDKYIYQTFAKKRGPPLQKGAIFQNAFLTKKSLGTQFSYIW